MNNFDSKLDDFLERLRSGKASSKEISEIEESLRNDDELRKQFRSRMRLESHLSHAFQAHQEEFLPFDSAHRPPPRQRSFSYRAMGIAASLLAAVFLIFFLSRPNPESTFAVLESASDAAWEGAINITDGSKLGPGRLRLQSGMASIRFDSGALVVLEAPAEFEIESAMRSRLLSGKALVEAPPSAQGFVVLTPHGFVTDHGTRFSVSIDNTEATCEVLEGEISLHHEDTGKVEHLLDQQASVLGAHGISKLDSLPSSVVRHSGKHSIRLVSQQKETSIVRSNERRKLLDPTMLMVKNSFLSDRHHGSADRRALFSFPLEKITPSQVDQVKLQLNLVPSGLGFAAYLPKTVQFSVYGISNEQQENWALQDLLWEEAPGFQNDPETPLDPDGLTHLGTIEISRGVQRGSLIFKSAKLTEFVKSDQSGEVGFLITRETRGIKNLSLVHAFASHQHPEAKGPTLEITLKSDANVR